MELPGLTVEQVQNVRQLLGKHSGVFAKSETDLGCTNVIEHEIPVVDEAPVRQRYRRIPPSLYEEVKAHIAQLLQHGIIRESSSPYSSPLVIVRNNFRHSGQANRVSGQLRATDLASPGMPRVRRLLLH